MPAVARQHSLAAWEAAGSLSLSMDFSTLRIGGNESPFLTPYYYGNEATVPRQAFESYIAAHGFWNVPGSISRPEQQPCSPLLLHAVAAGSVRDGLARMKADVE